MKSSVYRLFWFTLILSLIPGVVLPAQNSKLDSLKSSAAEAVREGNWQKAAALFDRIVKADPDDGESWYHLGSAYHHLENYQKAAGAYAKADSLNYLPAFTLYNAASVHSLMNRKDESIRLLQRAIDAGFRQVELLRTDSDFDSLRKDPRFQQLLSDLSEKTYPCLHNPAYQAFDFWVGAWDVYNQKGQKIGENIIRKDLKNCLILENWTSAFGSSGKSMNYIDPGSGKWKQNWVDEHGQVIRYEGEIVDGAMVFKGFYIKSNGETELTRVRLEPQEDGTVHHVIQHSKDNGENWYTWFDGIYVPKEE